MHILYIHQYFATPSGSTGTRSYEFARRWVAKGHEVTMLTSTAQLSPSDLSGAKGWLVKRCQIEGIDIVALSVPYKQQMGVLKRCLSFFGFFLCASIVVLFVKKVDIVYATSTPLTVGVPALVVKWLRNKRFVFEVRDQWPESVVEVGVLKNRFLIRIFLWLEKLTYKNAEAIVVVSEGMVQDIQSIAGNDKTIYIIPNGADLELFTTEIDGRKIRVEKGWQDKLVFLHAGAMGRINGLEFIIDAAEKVKSNTDILFVFVGQGSNKKPLEEKARKFGLTNIEFIASMPKQCLPEMLAAADVILAVIGHYPIIEKHASLNKFYDGLSAGKPVLLNYSGWQGQLLQDRHAGFGCKLCDIDDFVDKILYFRENSKKLTEMGKNSRQIAEERFDRDKLASQVLDYIETIICKTAAS